MTTMREDAEGAPTGPVPPGDRSVIATIRGLRWWATLLLALVLTVAGVTVDLLTADQLGVAFVACYGAGCVLAIVWAKRSEMFVPMAQPPLLLAVCVPAVVAAIGSLPTSGGLVAAALAIGGPMINGFPTMAITTAICLAIGFVRSKLQPWTRSSDELDGGVQAPRPRDPRRGERGRDERGREDRGREDRGREDRGREDRGREDRGDPRRPPPAGPSGRRPRGTARRPDRDDRPGDDRPGDDRPGDDPPRRPDDDRARRPAEDRPRRPAEDRPRRPDDRPRRPVDDRDPPREKRPPREEMRGREAGPGVYRTPGRPPPG